MTRITNQTALRALRLEPSAVHAAWRNAQPGFKLGFTGRAQTRRRLQLAIWHAVPLTEFGSRGDALVRAGVAADALLDVESV